MMPARRDHFSCSAIIPAIRFNFSSVIMEQLRTIFEKSLSSDEEKVVYELSDGEMSVRDIEKLTKIGRTKISSLWKKWYRMGIMEKSEMYEGKRMKRSFSLADVGIDVALPDNAEANKEEFE